MGSERLDRAVLLAAERHAGQFRDGAVPLPYLTHPLEVLSLLRYVGGETDEDLLIAAVLHDVIEESGTSASELEEMFGERAAGFVVALTREEPTPEQTEGMSKPEIWRMRAEMLLREIETMDELPRRVKLADRLSNVREAKRTKSGEKVERYLWQTRRILEIVPRETNPGLWDAIEAEV